MFSFFLISLVIMFFFLSGVISFISQSKHLLFMLLSLEYMMLNIFVILLLEVIHTPSEAFITLAFLTFVVIEGSVGLALLISVSRSHGSDQIKSFNLLW